MLNARSAAVLTDVLNGVEPVRLRDITTRYGVSERTAKHDIQQVRDWLTERGATLRLTASEGFHLDCSPQRRTALQEQAFGAEVDDRAAHRVVRMAARILLADPSTSINVLADDLSIARNTVLADMPQVDAALREAGVTLQRDRTGLAVEAPTAVRRTALVHVLRAAMREEDVVQCASWISTAGSRSLGNGHLLPALADVVARVDEPRALAHDVRSIAVQVSEAYGIDVSDFSVVTLLLRLLAVATVPDREAATDAGDAASTELLRAIAAQAPLRRWARTSADVDFAMFELGLRISSELLDHVEDQGRQFDVALVARTLIREVGRALDVDLSRDGALLPRLVTHLADRVVKIHHGILEPNAVLDEIVAQFPDVHRAVREATRRIFEPAGLRLGETDYAFITVHFATAIHLRGDRARTRALLVCGSGRGTTQLIRSVVEAELPDVDVIDTCSVFAAEQEATRDDVDLVISTFPFPTDKPLAVVHAIPTPADIAVIGSRLADVDPSSATRRSGAAEPRPGHASSFADTVLFGTRMCEELQVALGSRLTGETLEGFRLHCLLLAKRIVDGELYDPDYLDPREPGSLEDAVARRFDAWDVALPTTERAAIAAYFRIEEDR